MSVKVRISYETDAEINQILDLLAPMRMKVKMPVKKGERFMRAYLYDRHSAPYFGEHKKVEWTEGYNDA